ncbi:MAG TPA: right-handed parallel beta-helix repeat-containing protein [Leptolyngbyaceae cyanobacterium]
MNSYIFPALLIMPTLFMGSFNLQNTPSLTNKLSSSSTVQKTKIAGRKLIASTTATTYYVSGTGSDSNNGLTSSTAFRTIQKAADLTKAGDTVMIMNGLYTNAYPSYVAYINRSGTANAWIKFQAYPGHTPKIKHNGWHGIKITNGASYIEISGLEVEGNNANITLDYAKSQQSNGNNPLTSGNCISIDGRNTKPPHHIRILNNKVHDCGGVGIGTAQADYVTIDGNEVYNNAWYSVYANSGISIYQSWNFDSNTGYKMIATNNKVYNNRQYIPWITTGTITDGNGIIIDDSRNTQNRSTLGAYKGRTLVANNITYNNGGSGIHSYFSDNVDIVNNTAYLNVQSPQLNNGQIYASSSSNVQILNNIIYAASTKRVNSNWGNKNIVYNYNVYANSSWIEVKGANDIVAAPQFINPSIGDFRVNVNSPAINRGTTFNTVKTDFIRNARPSAANYDIGAYEYQF